MADNTKSFLLDNTVPHYATITDAAATGLNFTTDHTFETWIYLNKLPSADGTAYEIFDKDVGASRGYVFQVHDTADKVRALFFSAGGALSRFEMVQALGTGVWNHVAVSVDISVPNATWYLNNGTTLGSTLDSATTVLNGGTATLGVGADAAAGAQALGGFLDESRIWDDIRTANEVGAFWKNDASAESNLQAYWKYEDDFADASVNSNTLTGVGTPSFDVNVPFANYGVQAILDLTSKRW